MKKVLVVLAPGFEEIEALTPIGILRRAGAQVTVAGTIPGPIEGRSGIKVLPDIVMDKAGADYEMIILPGGAPGTENLKKDLRVKAAVEAMAHRGKYIAAICSAPTVLSAIGREQGETGDEPPVCAGPAQGGEDLRRAGSRRR